MSYYIFQGNPDKFDVTGYLEEAYNKNTSIRWHVSKYKNDLKPGDVVYIWQAKGSKKAISGIVAAAEVSSYVTETHNDEISKDYWKNQEDVKTDYKVDLNIITIFTTHKTIIREEAIKLDPVLNSMSFLKSRQGSNFNINEEYADRIEHLIENNGASWSKYESTQALMLYQSLKGKEVSLKPESPVAMLALKLGRTSTSIYNKIMNYRAIDPTDGRAGLSGASSVDTELWNEYYDPNSAKLSIEALKSDTNLTEVSEASDDHVYKETTITQRSRAGQSKFKRNLLRLYNDQCCITGCKVTSLLEAAHILDHSKHGINHTDNGLLLRIDIHRLFDKGLLSINPETFIIELDKALFNTEYWDLNGKIIRTKIDGSYPNSHYLLTRNKVI